MPDGDRAPTHAPQIVIVDRGRPDASIRTCRVVRATSGYDILLVHDGTAAGAFACLASMPGLRIECLPGAGFVSRLNAALVRLAPADVVRVDPGVVHLSDGWLDRLHDAASAHDAVGIAGVRLLAGDRRVLSTGRRLVHALGSRPHHANTGWMDSDGPQYREAGVVDAVAPSVVYLTRRCVEAIGGYDPAYEQGPAPAWMEQDDLCLRGWTAGWATVCLPHAYAQCDAPGFDDIEREWRDGGAGRNRWRTTWGWNSEFPDLHAVRARWHDTLVCRDIGTNLLDTWPTDPPDVDILLTTRNRVDRLRTLIPRLADTDYPRVHLYVFNDASTDTTREYLASLDGTLPIPLHVVHTPSNVGTHAGLNWLMAVSSSPLVVRLDDEVTLPRTWLARFVETLRTHPYAGVVGGKLCAEEFPDVVMNADTRWHPVISAHNGERDAGQLDYVSRVSVLFGSCLVYRRKAVERAGPFVALEDDMHHVLLAQRAGYDALYDGGVRILHPNKPVSLRIDRRINIRREELFEIHGRDAYEILDTSLDLAGRLDTNAEEPGTSPGEGALRARLGRTPDSVTDGLDLARLLKARGRRHEALSWLNAVVAAHPLQPEARLARAAHLIESGDLEAARLDIGGAGDSTAARVLRARLLLSERRLDDADAALAAIDTDTTGEADAVRGAIAQTRGDVAAAAEFLRRSLTARPSFAAAVNLSMACHTLGDDGGTRDALAQALRLSPSDSAALALQRALCPLDPVTCFAASDGVTDGGPLDIVFYAPWGMGPGVQASGTDPGDSAAAATLADALAGLGHRVRVFSDGFVPTAGSRVTSDRTDGLAAACTADRPDVVIGVRTCDVLATQRFAPLQVVWADGPASRFLVKSGGSKASVAGIDLWLCRTRADADDMSARFGAGRPRFLVFPAPDDTGIVAEAATPADWDTLVREALAGESPIVQRVVQHLAAGRAAVAHRILNAEEKPAAVATSAWTRLRDFVAWRAGQGGPPDDAAIADLLRAFGPFRRRITPDGLWTKPC